MNTAVTTEYIHVHAYTPRPSEWREARQSCAATTHNTPASQKLLPVFVNTRINTSVDPGTSRSE